MPLVDDGDVVRIPLPEEGEWAEVLRRLSRGQEVSVRRAVVAGARIVAGREPEVDAEAAIEAAEFATLEIAIKAWSFPVPVTPANIRRLDGASVDAIKVKLDELYGERTEAEKNGSGGSGAAPS